MASLSHKTSTVAHKVPDPAFLAKGELAINLKDRALYTKDQNGAIIRLNPESLVFSGKTPLAEAGKVWFDYSTGHIYAGYQDADSLQWVAWTGASLTGLELVGNPVDGDKSPDGKYVWNGTKEVWDLVGGGGQAAVIPDATATVKGIATLPPDGSVTAKGLVQLADAAAITAGTAGLVVDAEQAKNAYVAKAGDTMAGPLKLAVAAVPADGDDSDQVPSTGWVRKLLPAATATPGGAVASVPDATATVKGIATLPPDASASVKGLVQLANAAAVAAGTPGRVLDAEQAKALFLRLNGGTLSGLLHLAAAAMPQAGDNSDKVPSTSWVQALLNEWGKGRTFLRVKATSASFGGQTVNDTTFQFNAPGDGGVIPPLPVQLSFGAVSPTDAAGQVFWSWNYPFSRSPVVLVSANLTAAPAANLMVVAHAVETGMTSCKAVLRYISGTGAPAPAPSNIVHYLAFGPATALIP